MPSLSTLLSRIAVAFCFLSFGIWEIIDPATWIGYVPSFAANMVDAELLVRGHGIVLSIVGLGTLAGFFLPWFAAIAGLMILQICVELLISEGFTPIFVRDVTILLFIASLHASAVQPTSKEHI